jgi:hypothetical protein
VNHECSSDFVCALLFDSQLLLLFNPYFHSDGTAMTTEQVQGIVEYIPTQAEQKDLKAYMSAPGLDVASKFEALCECEKFMVAMMTVKHSKNKIRALLFKLQFESCMKDLMSGKFFIEPFIYFSYPRCFLHDSIFLISSF